MGTIFGRMAYPLVIALFLKNKGADKRLRLKEGD